MSVYDYKAMTRQGEKSLAEYKGKVLLIVNTASKCGFTPQYKGLEKLYETYKDQGLVVLGFPSNQFDEQEPGTDDEIHKFCSINYGVTFPIFAKGDVRGENAQPLFKYLIGQKKYRGIDESTPDGKELVDFIKSDLPAGYLDDDSIKWNFTKFLIDREGNVVQRYESTTEPEELAKDIEALL